MKTKLKGALAILAGLLLTTVLAIACDALLLRLFPGKFGPNGATGDTLILLAVLLYCSFFEFLGGYVTARLAPDRPVGHAVVFGLVGLALSVLSTIGRWNTTPAWYFIAVIILIVPAAWAGGRLRASPTSHAGWKS